MQKVSNAYKIDIRKKPFRNQSFMRVVVGVINQLAQVSAHVDEDVTPLSWISNRRQPFNGYESEAYYATAEQDFTAVDESMFFAPVDASGLALNQGLVSDGIKGAIKIVFDRQYNMRGLTFNFGKNYPSVFDLIYGNGTDENIIRIENDQGAVYRYEEILEGVSYVTVVPVTMLHGENRLRIVQFYAGIGITFTNRELTKSTKKEFIHPISEELPTIDFTATVDNSNRVFDIENTKSTINYMEVGQPVSVFYGYTLDNGEVEWMDGGNLVLSSWDADDSVMNFSAQDSFVNLNGTYKYGILNLSGYTLYKLAQLVFEDAHVESRLYYIDEYLRGITVYNPIPVVTHAEALQLIANAGRCILRQDREGVLRIEHSFSANRLPDMNLTATYSSDYSNPQSLISGNGKYHFAVSFKNTVRPNGQWRFHPIASVDETGYVTSVVANSSGVLPNTPTITVNLEASYKAYGMTLQFYENYPSKVQISSYLNDDLKEAHEVDVDSIDFYVDHEFPEADKFIIAFPVAAPNQGIILDSITFGRSTDYWFMYNNELTSYPKGTQTELVRNINQTITTYAQGTNELKELYKETITANKDDTIEVIISNPAYEMSATFDGEEATIIRFGSYMAEIQIPKSGTGDLILYGREWLVNKKTFSKNINTDGMDVDYDNPLISTEAHAFDVAEWEGDYHFSNREYTDVKYRGDPRIDANDITFMENKYVDNMMIRIYEHTIEFNGALHGTFSARRDLATD